MRYSIFVCMFLLQYYLKPNVGCHRQLAPALFQKYLPCQKQLSIARLGQVCISNSYHKGLRNNFVATQFAHKIII